MGIDRVTTSMGFRNFLDDLTNIRKDIDKTNGEISSGRRILVPSDDPEALSEVLQLRGSIAAFDQFAQNIGRAKVAFTFADSALNSVVNLLTVATEKGTAAANGTYNARARAVFATEIQNIKNQIVALANSSLEGVPIFAGQRVTSPPFVLDAAAPGGVRYDGDDGVNQIDVDASTRINLNTPGSQIFTGAANVFVALQTIIDGLNADDTAQITAGLSSLSAAFGQVRNARQEIGSKIDLAQRTGTRLADERLQLVTRVSELEDTNLAQAISHLAQEQTAENATLGIGARLNRRSLFDIIS